MLEGPVWRVNCAPRAGQGVRVAAAWAARRDFSRGSRETIVRRPAGGRCRCGRGHRCVTGDRDDPDPPGTGSATAAQGQAREVGRTVCSFQRPDRVDHGRPAIEQPAIHVPVTSPGSLIINVVDVRPVLPPAVARQAPRLKVSLVPAQTFGRVIRPSVSSQSPSVTVEIGSPLQPLTPSLRITGFRERRRRGPRRESRRQSRRSVPARAPQRRVENRPRRNGPTLPRR